jgi:hypothetical protein
MNRFEKATISIDWEGDSPSPAILCPITGKIVLAGYDPATGEYAEGVSEPQYENIPTATFYYLDELDEFLFIRNDIREAIDAYRKDLPSHKSEDLSDYDILSSGEIAFGKIPLIFALTTHGMSCGPVSSTVRVGLDLAVNA